MKVTAADGRQWIVRRRWFPKPPRLRLGQPKALGAADGAIAATGAHSITDLAVGIVFVAFLSALGWLVLPALLFVIQLVLLLVVLPAYVLARLVFRQPWIIEATTSTPHDVRLGWAVRGLRMSRGAMDEISASLQRGDPPTTSRGRQLAGSPMSRWRRY